MQLRRTLNQAEACAKFAVKGFSFIAHDFEPAAFRRTFRAKRADNDMAAWLDAVGDLPDVSNASFVCGKKMEYRAIMLEVVCTWFQLNFSDIGNNPTHLFRSRAQSLLSEVNGDLRDVEDGNVLVSANKQIVNEC